jgi:MtN3 and saliva related transmembrane protein
MDLSTLTGLAAACCTTFSFLPQAIKIIRTRDTASISLGMYAIFTLGTALWLAFGIATGNIPVIAANATTFLFAATILYFKLRYK